MSHAKWEWKVKTGRFQNGHNLYLNGILIGSCDWNVGRARGSSEADTYVGNVFLPSIVKNCVYGNNQEEVKAKVERVVNAWFDKALTKTGGK